MISLVIPALNEEGAIGQVVAESIEVLGRTEQSFEILVVDDGSTDRTAEVAGAAARGHEARVLRFRRNMGKSAALAAGLGEAKGDVIVLMDADGQDDADAIPALLAALDGGLDLVTGRRADRHDRFVKRITSKVYNGVTRVVTGVSGRDMNSGLKAMRGEVASTLALYGELHRFIPVLAHFAGFRVGEVDVRHRPRLAGSSKFGRARFWRGFMDLLTVTFVSNYRARPFHLLGGLGVGLAGVGSLALAWLGIVKLTGHAIGSRPLLLVSVMFVLVGVQLVAVGLLAELMVHLRHVPDHHPEWYVDEA